MLIVTESLIKSKKITNKVWSSMWKLDKMAMYY